MAKVRILGNAIYVTSAITLGDLLKLEKYNPKALLLYGGKEGEDLLYRVCTAKHAGKIDKLGAIFDATKDEGNPASISIVYTGTGDIKTYVKDELGVALVNLNKIEAAIPEALACVDADSAALDAMIEVIE